jgi:hypothetical protein
MSVFRPRSNIHFWRILLKKAGGRNRASIFGKAVPAVELRQAGFTSSANAQA